MTRKPDVTQTQDAMWRAVEAAGLSRDDVEAQMGDPPEPSSALPLALQVHHDYARYVLDHGTAEEAEAMSRDMALMNEVGEALPGGAWEPMTEVRLIDQLVKRADGIGKKRHEAARRYRGYKRSLEEERALARALIATQVMLALPLGKPNTLAEIRKLGNLGRGNHASLPLHGHIDHHLIVGARTPDRFQCWLVAPTSERSFRLAGWIYGSEAKDPRWARHHQRDGATSTAYWVPVEALRSVAEWWDL